MLRAIRCRKTSLYWWILCLHTEQNYLVCAVGNVRADTCWQVPWTQLPEYDSHSCQVYCWLQATTEIRQIVETSKLNTFFLVTHCDCEQTECCILLSVFSSSTYWFIKLLSFAFCQSILNTIVFHNTPLYNFIFTAAVFHIVIVYYNLVVDIKLRSRMLWGLSTFINTKNVCSKGSQLLPGRICTVTTSK